VFHDGNTDLGSPPLNGAGVAVAVLRTNTLAVGAHSLTASYAGASSRSGVKYSSNLKTRLP